ncbi:2-keto-4-pentenoate hydratase [Candidatus Burkholderia verschuerenii]|uniref:2-keto-4-pentenoate hydratase n=1 Tax=Candidatus Burkholderia verschuerenii TaxID=242163 RepID=A0A0L0MEP6_9BURK|nr:hydratase [Candidatus Burkholderia verschuerenii]KND61152.1 2-keto-4-pentenoate hydratase [Candidatus Burkholderia verschuerenii]
MTGSTLPAKLLDARRQHRLIDTLAPADIPADAPTAYAIQHEALRETDARIGAWKIGARAPDALATGAPIDAALVHASPARLPFDSFFRVLVELELAFRFSHALMPRSDPYTRDEVFAAIGGMAVALEVVDSRFAQWPNLDPLAQLADSQNNGALIVSGMEPYEVIAPGFDFLAPRLEFTLDGMSIAPEALGNPAGDPRELLVWLVNHCSRMELAVEPFWTITTGSYTGAYRVEGPAMVHGSIDRVGELELVLS